MYAHRLRITVPENHEITVRLPSDGPPGEAELIVLTESPAKPGSGERIKTWLDTWMRALPRMEAHILDAGHLLLETHAATAAALMLDFIARTKARPV